MKVIFLVLNKVDKLDQLLLELSNNNLQGATIITSIGMAQSIYNTKKSDGSKSLIMDSLRILLRNENSIENKTIFAVVNEEQEKIFCETVNSVIGSLSKQNTGVLFTVPIDSIQGVLSSNSSQE